MAYRCKKRLTWRSLFTLGSVFLLFSIIAIGNSFHESRIEIRRNDATYTSRRLLSLSNCTPPAIEQFPKDYFSHSQRHQGAIVLHIILAAYMFLALALVCDDYFVPSCERYCQVLRLQEDVAGATFVAAGSSAPELATAVIGVFIAKDDIGLGAVVGSAVFNIMLVISLCALCAGTVVYLKWWPLVRDCIFYTLSIIALVLVIMDEQVCWYEALAFLIMYALYIVLMFFNRSVEAWIVPKFPNLGHDRDRVSRKQANRPSIANNVDEERDIADAANSTEFDEWDATGVNSQETALLLSTSEGNGGQFDSNHTSSVALKDPEVKMQSSVVAGSEIEEGWSEKDDESSVPWVWDVPKSWCRYFVWLLSLPLIAIMFITVPDCRQTRWKNWFHLTFIMSIIWIGIYSYFMVWMITVVGHTWHVPDSVMGLTFIAAGSSVPDAIASLLVVREGHGDMAISNAVGSNVFDILLCLGLPWFLQTTVVDRSGPIQVYSAGLTYSSLTLLTTVVLLLVSTHINRWRLTKPYGVFLLVIYILFNILSCLYELNFFGFVHPDECPSLY